MPPSFAELSTLDPMTALKRAEVHARTGSFGLAAADYEHLAKYYTRQGNVPHAIAVYRQLRRVTQRDEGDLEVRYGQIVADVADLYERLGYTEEARAAFDEAAKRWAQQGRNADAAGALKRLLALDPSPAAHVRLAEGLARARDIDGAVRELELAAREYTREGRTDDALRVLERLLYHRLDLEHARTAARLYLARRAPRDGVRALQKLRPCYATAPEDLETLGLVDKAFALAGYTRRSFEAQKAIARVARERGRDGLFCETVARLAESAPKDPHVRGLMREANVVQARRSHAGTSVLRALRVPESPPRPVRPLRA